MKKIDSFVAQNALNTFASTHASNERERERESNARLDSLSATPHKSLKISFCLASALFASSTLLETASAACNLVQDDNRGGVGYSQTFRCTGSMVSNSLHNNAHRNYYYTNYYINTYIQFGGNNANQRLTLTDTSEMKVTFNASNGKTGDQQKNHDYRRGHGKHLQLGFLSAPDTTVAVTSEGRVTANVSTIGTANISKLKLSAGITTDTQEGDNWDGDTVGKLGTVTIGHSSVINTGIEVNGALTTLNGNGGAYLGTISTTGKTGSIGTFNLGQSNQADSVTLKSTDLSKVSIGTLNINSYNLVLGNTTGTDLNAGQSQIKVGNTTNVNVGNNGITLSRKIGDTVSANRVYFLNDLVSGGSNAASRNLTRSNVTTASGFDMQEVEQNGRQGYIIVASASTTYAANMYRALAMSNMRRNTMTQNILDTMTTKTFHSDRFYNQEVELRLLQYDMSRLTNRSSKFSKQTRKNQKKVDKVRERIAKLTLEQSKGQNLDKGYNNFEVIDQLDAIFIPYTGRRDWRFFALPYATHTYGFLGANESMEYAGGALFGVQRNLRAAGIFGGYVGYEFANTDTNTSGADTRVQTHSLQLGANYFKTFAITSKVWEGFIKANIRGGVDLPDLRFVSGSSTLKIQSNEKASSIPLMYNIGAEVKGGVTFYQFRRNSYIAPAVSLSYDMLSVLGTKLIKPQLYVGNALTPGNDEFYNSIFWHLPQLGVDVRYYKMWGNTFRTNLKAGIKYNMLNTQQAFVNLREHRDNKTDNGSKYGASERASTPITLPAVYGNVAFDLIWMVKKNHELSFGYDGLFFASSFAKEQGLATNDWFNGVTTTLNFKYAYWFGGSDYVTDKDGNAVARSIAEGGKKSKKSKKPKKKKTKKKKSKVVYIDG